MSGQATGYAVRCTACGLTGEPVASRTAAVQLAQLHNTLHHRGRPAATVEPLPAATRHHGADAARGFLEPPRCVMCTFARRTAANTRPPR